MMFAMRHVHVYFMTVLFTVFLTACSGSFGTRPSGNINNIVFFAFYEGGEDEAVEEAQQILSIMVQQKEEDGNWKFVLWLEGEEKLSRFIYGKKYEGLNEIIPTEKLLIDKRYRVLARGESNLGPIRYSEATFRVSDSGDIVVIAPIFE